jgi:hypothetical protein
MVESLLEKPVGSLSTNPITLSTSGKACLIRSSTTFPFIPWKVQIHDLASIVRKFSTMSTPSSLFSNGLAFISAIIRSYVA